MNASQRERLLKQYASAVQEYLSGDREAALEQGYDLGREAVRAGLGLLEMTAIHKEALVAALRGASRPGDGVRLAERLMDFFGESMGAFEMVYRGYQDANEGLRRSEAQLRLLTDSLPVLIAYVDRDLTCHFANRTCERWCAQPKDALVGRRFEEIVGTPAFERLGPHVEHVLSGTAATFEETVPWRDGKTRSVDATFVPRMAGERAVEGFFALIHDETDRKTTETQLRHAQKMEAIGQLTGGIAHDFNNLLTVIIGNLDILSEPATPTDEHPVLAEAAMGAALRGSELTSRLLAFARRQPLSPQAIDLNERLPALVTLLKRTLGESIAIRTTLASDLWITDIDPSQVEDAVVNLAINARDAMPQGGTLTIETRNVSLDADYAARNAELIPGDYTLLAVTDTGCGMPPDVAERVFEPFFSTKAEGKGTGLGLSMVYGFVKQSRGHVKIYSEVGLGTTVNLYFPRSASDSSVARDRRGDRPALQTGTESILVVEDDEYVRAIVVAHLIDLGYRIQAVANGPEAARVLDGATPFDLLFTDVVMPGGMTGYDLADVAATRRPGIKMLFTTGYAGPPEAAGHARHAGAPLVRKPFRKQELAHAIRAALDGG